jgi:hypothetical protein
MEAEIVDRVILALDVEQADPALADGDLTAGSWRNISDARDGDEFSFQLSALSPEPYCFLTIGLPSLTHSFHPPRSARMLFTPRSFSISAARALVASSTQAQ